MQICTAVFVAVDGGAECVRFACARWNEGRDIADPITRSHFRHVYSATADDPTPLVADGTPCIKVHPLSPETALHTNALFMSTSKQ